MSKATPHGIAASARRALAAAVLALVAGSAAAGAQDAPMKIAVIDVGRILEESVAGQAAIGELKTLAESKQAELDQAQAAAKEIQDRINQGRMSLSEEKLDELRKELERKVIDLQRRQDDANREIEEMRIERFGKIERRIMPVIQRVGAEFGYSMIFKKFQSGLVYARDEIDITNLILERFNQAESQD